MPSHANSDMTMLSAAARSCAADVGRGDSVDVANTRESKVGISGRAGAAAVRRGASAVASAGKAALDAARWSWVFTAKKSMLAGVDR